MMNRRQIEIANAEASVSRWEDYVMTAEENGDEKRAAYGRIRLTNARKRLTAWKRA